MSTLDRLRTALADRYTLERELGAGGMATVHLAHDRKHDHDVATKVLHPDLGAAVDESGANEVYLRPFPSPTGGRWWSLHRRRHLAA
jgi:hypothetical protein